MLGKFNLKPTKSCSILAQFQMLINIAFRPSRYTAVM